MMPSALLRWTLADDRGRRPRGAALRHALRLAAVILSAGGASAQSATPQAWQAWRAAVVSHAPGARDAAVVAVAPWAPADLTPVVAALAREAPEVRRDLVARGLVLHTDTAILHRTQTGYDLPSGPGSTMLFRDGQAAGRMTGTFHWEFGRRLLDTLPPGEDRLALGRLFYRATTAVLQQWAEHPEFLAHLAAGRALLGDDPVLLLYEGTMHQAFAGARVQRFFDDERRRLAASRAESLRETAPPIGGALPGPILSVADEPPTAAQARVPAERLFRRALAVDPSLVEARIRLAHVSADAGRHEEAAGELARATAGALPPFLDYYAALLTGRTARTLGRLEAAERAFTHARALYPRAPAPRLALSELALARGDRAGSQAHLTNAVTTGRDDPNEPWWWIDRMHEPSADALVAEMYRVLAP